MQHDRPTIPSHPWSLPLASTTYSSLWSNTSTGVGTWPWWSLPPIAIGRPEPGICSPSYTWRTYPVVAPRAPLWQCGERLVVQQVRRCPHIPVKSANSNTGGTLCGRLWQHPTSDTCNERLPGLRTSQQHTRLPHEDKQRTTSTTWT